jgi:hypothetical protein
MFQYMKFERMTAFFEQQEEGKQKKLLASSAILSMLGLAFWFSRRNLYPYGHTLVSREL